MRYTNSSSKKMTPAQTTNRTNAFVANTEIKRQLTLKGLEQNRQLEDKYASIDSMDRKQKLEVLGHKGVDPRLLKDPYDKLSVVLDRWKHVADDAVLSHYDDAKKQELAGKYYDALIAPQYAGMQKPPMNRDIWLKQAFKEATQYKLENAYDNDMLHDLKHGWNNGLPSLARFGEGVYNIVSNLVAKPVETTDANYKEMYWADRAHAATSTPESFTDARNPDSAVNRGSRVQQEEHQFWADALPTKGGWGSKATSFIAEQAAQLPVYAALAAVPATAGESLTARLGLTGAGKKALSYLLTAGEGTAYGTLTRPKGDKENSWQDGLSWMMFHMGFDVTGKLGSKVLSTVGQRGKVTLQAAAEASGDQELLQRLRTKQDNLELALQGKELAGGEEQYAAYKKEAATNMAAVGVHGQREIYADALRHIENMEQVEGGKWTRTQVKDYEKELLTQDPARWSPTLAAANYVRALLGETKLRSIETGSPEMKHIIQGISRLVVDAAAEMPLHVPELAQHEAASGAQATIANKSALKTLEYFKAQVQKDAQAAGAASLLKPEEIEEAAKKQYINYIRKVTQKSAQALGSDTKEDAATIIKKHRAEVKAARSSAQVDPLYRQQTRRAKDYVWYSVAPDYSVQLAKRAKAEGASANFNSKEFSDWLGKHYSEMGEGDFAQDIEDHFYPQALKEAGIYFEHQNAGKAGPEYPNFLAFMHNYSEQMPKEMAQELEERLIRTDKFQKAFKAGAKTEDILDYYSTGMYNHVDDFLGSGHWPKETNIFRSTFDLVRGTTKYQVQLLKEKMAQEQKALVTSLAKYPEAQSAALKALKGLQNKRMEAFKKSYEQDRNSRETVYALNELITQELTKHKLYDRWEF